MCIVLYLYKYSISKVNFQNPANHIDKPSFAFLNIYYRNISGGSISDLPRDPRIL